MPIPGSYATALTRMGTFPGPLAPLGYEQITVSTAAVGLTVPSSDPIPPLYALIQVESQGIRWRDDGTDPTSTIGVPVPAGASLEYSADLDAIKFIRSGGSDSTLNVSYYG